MYTESGVPKFWFNIIPFIERVLGFSIPPLLDPASGDLMSWEKLSSFLPSELAKQEIGVGLYRDQDYIAIPERILNLYQGYRPSPLVRAKKLENALGLDKVRIHFKREDLNQIRSYKLNSSYVQAYYAQQEQVNEFVAGTGPGNWGMGIALAAKEFAIPMIIYMEQGNYDLQIDKVRYMESCGATVIPISTEKGTISESISVELKHLERNSKNKLSLGCLTAYSALHNSVIGLELKKQLNKALITPLSVIGVTGGGSSYSGFAFPLLPQLYGKSEFLAVESEAIPSFTKGEYKYENPDTIGLMPKAKMYTLGVDYAPQELSGSGLNYHGKNHLLSLLVNKGIVKAKAYPTSKAKEAQQLFYETEGINSSIESCFAILAAIDKAKEYQDQDKEGDIVFLLTGSAWN